MNQLTARTRLTAMTAATVDPQLTSDQIDDLLLMARQSDSAGNPALSLWAAQTPYAVGAVIGASGHVYTVYTAGVSATTEPIWTSWDTDNGALVIDGTVKWAGSGVDPWQGNYGLNWAAAEGWRWKAAQAAADFTFSADGGSYAREQVVKQCLEMAKQYTILGGVY